MTCAPVTVKPANVLPQMNVYISPLAHVGSVQEGVPLEEAFLNTCPDCAAVRTTVAPAAALSVTVVLTGPVGATVKDAAPVTARVDASVTAPVTASVLPRVTAF